MQKLFVFDCDGTLINDQREINYENVEAINKLIKLNHKVCLCTGRNFNQLEKYLKLMPGIELVGSLNGACIHQTIDNSIKYQGKPLSKELIKDVVDIAKKTKREIHWTNKNQKMYRVYFGTNPRNDINDESFFKVGTINPKYDNWLDVKDDLYNNEILQISAKIEYSKVLEHYEYLKHKYHDNKLNDITLSSKVYIDITPLNCNKASATNFFKNYYNIDTKNTYCFGDSDNDLKMIIENKNTFAMDNGTNLIKYYANWTIGNNNSNAIAKAIDNILSNRFWFKQLEPSLLAFDINNIKQELSDLKKLGIECIHYDVMDEYVNNHSFDNEWLDIIHEYGFQNTIHFMVYEPIKWFARFIKYHPYAISFQFEPLNEKEVFEAINYLKKHYIKAGIAIKPTSKPEEYIKYLDHIDFVTIMTVEPGKGGQELIDSSLDNLKFVYNYRNEHKLNYKIQADGGIKIDNAKKVIGYCDFVVSGTGFMKLKNEDKKQFIKIVKGAYDE